MAEDYRDRARRRAQERSASIWLKLKEGDTTFRILPTPGSKTTPDVVLEYAVHREIGPPDKRRTVRCGKDPLNNYQGDCWLCDVEIPRLRNKGHDNRADLMAARDVMALQVAVVTKDSDENLKFDGPFIFNPAKTVGNAIFMLLGSRKRDYAHPKKGYNLTIDRTGTGKNDTRYIGPVPDDESSEVPLGLVGKLKPFSELKEIPVYSMAAQKAAVDGKDLVERDEDAADEREERPAPRRAEPRAEPKRGSARAEEEDDDDLGDPDEEAGHADDADADPDEEEDEKQRRRPPAGRATRRYDDPIDEDAQEAEDTAQGREDESDDDPPDVETKPKPKGGVVPMKNRRR